ncbi:hypothetical protein J4422_02370 [Candidatus Pacearchaeota archaeon]|nr:hypothetical protein [Candidatus Pacearchaeota archaeon]
MALDEEIKDEDYLLISSALSFLGVQIDGIRYRIQESLRKMDEQDKKYGVGKYKRE